MAGAALTQGQVHNSWQAQHFGNVRYRFHGRHSTYARLGTDFVAGTLLSRGQVQRSRQAQQFRKVRYRFGGRSNAFAGQVQNSWQAQHFGNARYGRHNTFARLGADFLAGAMLSQVQIA